ncbi:hypothetical protein V5279_41055 [Bradyrhizobium sp. 26S5]|uniref:hypothetical protein n=1 Tax=Bradyrhizobium sp. 26S5 TaxID=3139729 RepID=UPI0030D2563E
MCSFVDEAGIEAYQLLHVGPSEFRIITPPHIELHPTKIAFLQRKFSEYLQEQTIVQVDNSGQFIETVSGKRNLVVKAF